MIKKVFKKTNEMLTKMFTIITGIFKTVIITGGQKSAIDDSIANCQNVVNINDLADFDEEV